MNLAYVLHNLINPSLWAVDDFPTLFGWCSVDKWLSCSSVVPWHTVHVCPLQDVVQGVSWALGFLPDVTFVAKPLIQLLHNFSPAWWSVQFFPFIYKMGDFANNVLSVLCDAIGTIEVMEKNQLKGIVSLLNKRNKLGSEAGWMNWNQAVVEECILFCSLLDMPEILWILLINMSKNVKYIMPKFSFLVETHSLSGQNYRRYLSWR